MLMVAGVLIKGKQGTGLGELTNNAQTEDVRRWQKQSLALMKLTRPQALNGRDFKAVMQEITEVAADALEVEQVSIWLYNQDCSQLDCIDLYELCADYQCQGYGGVGKNTLTPPITSLSHSPRRLDMPICLNDQVVGVVSYEQIGASTREWTNEDENFGAAIANIVGLKLEMCDRQQTIQTLSESIACYRSQTNEYQFSINQLAEAKQLGAKFLAQSALVRRLPLLTKTSAPPTRSRISSLAAVVEDRLIGVMMLLGNQPLTSESRRTFGWVANAIAVAIDQYWARSEFLSSRESLLFGLANQIRKSLELPTILETAVESIRSLLKIDRCQFLWYKPHEQEPYWQVVKEARNPRLPNWIGEYAQSEMAPFAQKILNAQIIQVDEVDSCSDSELAEFLIRRGYASLLAIPIQTRAGEIGAISCGHGSGDRPWDNSEVELLQAVVAQLAIAVDQAEIYAEARQTAEIAQAQAQELERALNQLKATQAQLVHSEKMSSLGQLVAGVAHELNNPVNFIHNNLAYATAYIYDLLTLVHIYQDHYPNPVPPVAEQAELIDIDFITEDLPKLLRSMQRGTDRISSIVNSLRSFSRLDGTEMKAVDLNQGIDSTLLLLQHRLKPKDPKREIQVFKEYDNLPKVECYPGQINQVFMNIISNAIDALDQSRATSKEEFSAKITIRTQLIDHSEHPQDTIFSVNSLPANQKAEAKTLTIHNSQSVVIQIADNGSGMTEFVKTRLFDPFFSTKPVGQGTGLGLAICYQIIVEHHHGILNCTSVPGKGTEFWIEIPIYQRKD